MRALEIREGDALQAAQARAEVRRRNVEFVRSFGLGIGSGLGLAAGFVAWSLVPVWWIYAAGTAVWLVGRTWWGITRLEHEGEA